MKCPSCQHLLVIEKPDHGAVPNDGEVHDEYGLAAPLEITARSGGLPETPDSPRADTPPGDQEPEPADTECPACGVMIAAGESECRACRFNLQVGRRVEDFSGGDHYAGTVGFERYFLKRMHQSESLASMFIWVHAAFVFLLGLVCFFFLDVWLYIAIPALILYGAYQVLAYAHGYFYRGKSFFWAIFLRVGRLSGWRRLSGFKKRTTWCMHDPSLTDERIGNRQDLSSYHVLDLQGTGITDAGLGHFEFLPLLEFLVLKNTNVTADGVAQLQATIPETCIWY
ncbi:MAG: hypothetical protein QGH11_04985 [Pirellulaceae bacterium]|nr:hypothetical protein [Pirellulaceae bacterium]